MGKPVWISLADWQKVNNYAVKYGTIPELLAAIGWHETHWGKLGWGRQGFYLGVGAYSETKANYAYQGLDNQLNWAARKAGQYLGSQITEQRLINFANDVWKPGNRIAWGKSVFSIYKSLGGSETIPSPDIPEAYDSDTQISVEKELNSIEKSVGSIRSIINAWVSKNQ